jgi:phospholipid-translocating ATPase
LHLSGETFPKKFPNNKIDNQKYNPLNFLPKVLYNEFKFFFNLFFLLIALSQFVEPLRVGFLFTYIAPLTIVLLVTMIREAFDDFARYRRDKAINLYKYKVYSKGVWKDKYSRDLKVGHLVKVNQNERLPADLVCCYTTETKGTIFIRTDQLDGETDWKLRRAIGFIQRQGQPDNIPSLMGEIVVNPPTNKIYDFQGYYENRTRDVKESLNLEHSLWCNTVLASSGYIIGMVVYTGKHTRSAMNSKSPSSKVGKVDYEINKMSKILFVMMVMFAGTIIILDGLTGLFYIKFFRFLLLLSSIIPISLRVNLDLAKIWYSYCIDHDDAIPDTKVRNSSIPEELGRIQWLLSDKTGTLTRNEMELKKINLEYTNFTVETMKECNELLRANCEKHDGPFGDLDNNIVGDGKKQNKMKKRRDPEYSVRDMLTALAVCHNVTPSYNNDGEREFQASSPDEVALVRFVDSIGLELLDRDEDLITIRNTNGVTEKYIVLANFPFSSESKRMGIIVRHEATGRYIFYLKGAEVVIEERVVASQRTIVKEHCENLSMEGLRTLVICQKVLTEEEFEEWKKEYNEAQASLQNRDANVQEVIEQLEYDMELLGVTGVEDKLQEDVQITIESFRNAGINIWMLTGDKVETATCIAISAGLKHKTQRFKFLKEIRDKDAIEKAINEGNEASTCLVIDGTTLDTVLRSEFLEHRFIDYASKCPAVLVCRCSPTQKAIITKRMKEY